MTSGDLAINHTEDIINVIFDPIATVSAKTVPLLQDLKGGYTGEQCLPGDKEEVLYLLLMVQKGRGITCPPAKKITCPPAHKVVHLATRKKDHLSTRNHWGDATREQVGGMGGGCYKGTREGVGGDWWGREQGKGWVGWVGLLQGNIKGRGGWDEEQGKGCPSDLY